MIDRQLNKIEMGLDFLTSNVMSMRSDILFTHVVVMTPVVVLFLCLFAYLVQQLHALQASQARLLDEVRALRGGASHPVAAPANGVGK